MKYLNILLTTWALLFSSLVFATENTGRYDNLTTNNPSKTSIGVNKDVDISSTGGLYIPKGTTGQRPTPTKDGLIRFNSTTGKTELYANSAWGTIGGGLSAWATATVYAVGDIVIQTNKIYKCIAGHTSGTFATDLGNNDWVEVSAGVSDHTQLTNIGTNTHAQIDTAIANSVAHIANTSNPHAVTAAQVGLGNVNNTSDATKNSATATLTNKTIDGLSNTLTNITATTNANLTGEVTSVGNAATVTNSAVIAKTLTGFSSAAGTISATDSILQALQKADGNTALKLGNTKADVDGSPVSTTQLNYPNAQATTISGSIRRVETGSSNLLADPSFEKSTLPDWSCTLGTKSQDTNNHTDGSGSLKIVSAGAGIRCQQISTTNAASLKGQQMVARISVSSTDSALQACAVVDGTDTNCATVPVTTTAMPFQTVEIPFIAGGTSNGIALKSTTTTVQSIYADEAMAGKMAPFQNVNGAQLLGTLNFPETASCVWANASTSYVGFSAVAACPAPTITGQVKAAATKIPAVVIPAGSPAGTYVVVTGGFLRKSGSTAETVAWRLHDGTNPLIGNTSTYAGTSVASSGTIPAASVTYTTSLASDKTIEVQARVSNASTTGANIQNSPGDGELSFQVYYYPPASRIYSQSPNDIVSSDSMPFAFKSTAIDTNSDPVGTFNTFTYATSSNTPVIATTAPTQTVASMNADGVRLFAKAFNTTSTAASPARFEIYIGKGLKSRQVEAYASTGKLSPVLFSRDTNGATESGVTVAYSETTGILRLDAGLAIATNTTRYIEAEVGNTNAYMVFNASREKLITGSFAGIEKCANDYECTGEFSAQVSSAGVVSNENLDWINGNAVVSATSNFLFTLNTNLKDGVSGLTTPMNCTITERDQTGGTLIFAGMVLPTTTTINVITYLGGVRAAEDFMIHCQKAAQDFKPKTAKVASSRGVNYTPDSINTYNLLSAYFRGATSNTACTTGTCTLVSNLGGFLSAAPTRTSTGFYSATITSGKFSGNFGTGFNCWCTSGVNASQNGQCSLLGNTSDAQSTTLTMYNTTQAGVATDAQVQLFCHGIVP